jgi:pantothenate kinase
MLHLKLLEKQEQEKLKSSRRREIIKTRAKINEIETKKKNHTSNQQNKIWFLEKINKIYKPLVNLTTMRKEKTQISKIRNKKGR